MAKKKVELPALKRGERVLYNGEPATILQATMPGSTACLILIGKRGFQVERSTIQGVPSGEKETNT